MRSLDSIGHKPRPRGSGAGMAEDGHLEPYRPGF